MDERELLELAAKAAGIAKSEKSGFYVHLINEYYPRPWSPLTDDGDALRLAVKLKLDIEFPDEEVWVTPTWSDWPITRTEEVVKDIYAATRRAIVKAAAEIGKAMG